MDLIVGYGAAPVIVPRVSGMHALLESFEPFHGVLLCEGEDIDPSLYGTTPTTSDLSADELEEIRRAHASDTAIDHEKDAIECRLAKLCIDCGIPILGICRGSQVLNISSGGKNIIFILYIQFLTCRFEYLRAHQIRLCVSKNLSSQPSAALPCEITIFSQNLS